MIPGRLPWMSRTHEDYDPNGIGALTQAKVATALIEAGKIVLFPWVQVARYDLVIEDKGTFSRIQCKTGQLFRGKKRIRWAKEYEVNPRQGTAELAELNKLGP